MSQQLRQYEREGDYSQLAVEWVNTYAEGLAGQRVDDIATAAESFWDEHWDLVYSSAQELVHSLLAYCDVVAVSGSPIEGLAPLFHRLGIRDFEVTTIERGKDGIFTGKVIVNRAVGPAKEEVVLRYRRIRRDESLWRRSFGFGDTDHDFPLMEHVGSPYLIRDCSTEEKAEKAEKLYDELHARALNLQLLRLPQDAPEIPGRIRQRINAVDRPDTQ
jgi:phosphoserine phosphatase